MIRHFFRLVWNRRKRNGLIMVEILVSFLLLCAIFTMGSAFFLNWNDPLGFDYHDVWVISVRSGAYESLDEEQQLEIRRAMKRVEDAVSDVSDVVAAGMQTNVPYAGMRWATQGEIDGEEASVGMLIARPSVADVLRLELIEGRWLEESDAAMEERPVILTRDYAELIFPGQSAIGQLVPPFEDDEIDDPDEKEPQRIVGVMRPYRRRGEHRPAEFHMMTYLDYETLEGFPPQALVVRVRPGSPVQLEADLLKLASRIAPQLKFSLTRMEDLRTRQLEDAFLPLAILSVVTGFLILMVGLGLIGVLWQSVTRRTQEIGVRRAMGATAAAVRFQIIGELLALTSIAVLVGSAIYLQFPLLGLLEEKASVVTLALGASLFVMYGFVIVCGLYPSWLATRIEPARALGYE